MKKNKKMTQEEILEKELENNKDVEYYSHLVNSWITTRMEKDKAILTLSTAGLGVLVSFFSNISYTNITASILYGLALISFILAIISGIWILSENANYCEAVICDETPKNDKLISILDYSLICNFIFGLIVSIILSFSLIYEKDLKEESNKSLENKISSLKKDYDNNLKELQNYLIEIEKLEANKKEISNLKNKLEQNINNLTNDLESIKKLKEKELLLQTESKQIKMENN
ncbi:hypothetical protein [Aliarcobacter butzleri]|uniref:hypothetical protein n=1 Tax=Aliarcobacter butzleri TaxID=28197 RepID=UPI002B248894|nr:hypothetical protein [Aliarcobacter butzleri]